LTSEALDALQEAAEAEVVNNAKNNERND